MADGLARYVRNRLQALKNERSSWDAHWRELASYLMPRRARFLTQNRNRGDKMNGNIVDGTGTLAARTQASGMQAGLTSQARPWFRLTTPDPALAEQGDVKAWLHQVEQRIYQVLARSNFYKTQGGTYADLGLFGTAPKIILEDDDTIVRFYPVPVGQYCLALNERLAVDTLYREYSLSVRQIYERYVRQPGGGEDWSVASEQVKTAYDNKRYDDWIEVIHAIEPNPDMVPDSLRREQRPWRSITVEANGRGPEDRVLRLDGYYEQPFVAPRWLTVGEDIYGHSPGMDALGDVKQLQQEQKRKLEAIDKMLRPPMNAPTTLRNVGVTILPGEVNFADTPQGMEGVKPAYQIQPQLQHLLLDMQATQERIRTIFFADLFQMLTLLDRRQMTATEVAERHEEKLLMLGPVLESVNGEDLDPTIDRVFAIMNRRGMFEEPPEMLQGVELRVEYISILAQAQRMVATQGIERLATFVSALAPVIPSVLDKMDFDQAVDEYSLALGTAPKIVRTDEDVAEIRKGRQAQERAAAMAQPLKDASTALKNAGTTPMEGDTALNRILETAGAAAPAVPAA